jgi:hypothetical protein
MYHSNTPITAMHESKLRKLKEKIAALAKSEATLVKNMQHEMVTRLQARLGKTKEEILAIIARL